MKKPILFLCFIFISICLYGQGRWVGTWAAATQITPEKFKPRTTMDGASLRQIVRVSIGGEQLRLQPSNRYGNGLLRIHDVYIAPALDSCQIDTSSVCHLTFSGQPSVTIEAGMEVYSDAADFHLSALQPLSITINYEACPQEITCHNGSFSTSYIHTGISTPDTDFTASERVNHWYNISAIDVWREDALAVAILGNSITDGHGSTMNAFTTWPDIMASALSSYHVGVLNLGIGANCVTLDRGLGEPAVMRFDHDILGQQGVEAIIVFQGVNDIGAMKGDTTLCERTAANLIAAYHDFIQKAHRQGIKIFGATITPFYHSKYYKPGHEQVRQTVTRFIRESGAFDDVIDFDIVVRDDADIRSLRPDFHCGDWLHPNDAGYRAMGEFAITHLLRNFSLTAQ